MNKLSLLLLATLLFLPVTAQVVTQSCTPAVAMSGEGCTLSMGQTVTATLTADGIVLTQGALQGTIKINASLVDDVIAEYMPKMYPCPVSDVLNITKFDYDKCELSIYNVMGARVIMKTFTEKHIAIDCKHLAADNYVVRIANSDGKVIYTGKIIKK